MSKSNLLKKTMVGAALIATSALASAQTADSTKTQLPESTASNIEWHFTKGGSDKARINLFYNLPLKTSGYSFMEFYGKGGYFGKDMLYTPVFPKLGVGVKTETKHALFTNPSGEETSYNTIGFGLEKQGTLPGGIFASVKFLPVVFGKGGVQENNMILGYVASKIIPINENLRVNLSSFLDFNIAGKKGPECDYGETDATLEHKTKLGQFDYGIGFNHNVTGNFAPDNQFRVRLGYHPRK